MDYQPVIAWVRKNVKRDLHLFPIFAPESMREAMEGYAKLREIGGFLGEDLRYVNGKFTFRLHDVIFVSNPLWHEFWLKFWMSFRVVRYGAQSTWWQVKAVAQHFYLTWKL